MKTRFVIYQYSLRWLRVRIWGNYKTAGGQKTLERKRRSLTPLEQAEDDQKVKLRG